MFLLALVNKTLWCALHAGDITLQFQFESGVVLNIKPFEFD